MEFNLESSWKKVLEKEFSKPYFLQLIHFIEKEYSSEHKQIFPPINQIFRALDLCLPENVKVVIIGQDPYPTRGYAEGLSFSVQENVKPFPKSLNNIFKELESDTGIPIPQNGSLIRWAEQGVLLLNTVLTVVEGKPDSHAKKGWEKFTDAIIEELNKNYEGIVYILWGSKAQVKEFKIDSSKNLILKSVHPSPLSSYRGFFGSKHFSQANKYLTEHGKTPIEW